MAPAHWSPDADGWSHLDVCGGRELGPVLPVVLVEGILNGLDWRERERERQVGGPWLAAGGCGLRGAGPVTWVVPDEAAVQVSQLLSADMSARVVGRLEVQVVLPTAVELRRRHVHPDDDLIGVTGFIDGQPQQLQS